MELALMDLEEVLKPPGLDVLLVLAATIGAIVVSVMPVTDPASFSRGTLDPTMLALVIFLAIRSASGIASLTESGLISVYLSYPLPRPGVYFSLLASRVVAPSLLILAVPLATSFVTLKTTMLGEVAAIACFYLAFVTQAVFYGSTFSLIALILRSHASSGIVSVAFYLIIAALNGILPTIGTVTENEFLVRLGESLSLPDVVYKVVRELEYDVWQLAVIPVSSLIVILTAVSYFARRFEAR